VLLAAIAIFILASLGCALSVDVWSFLAFRILQAAIISGWATARAAIRDMHEPQQAASLLGYVSMAMAVAPMLGPVVGGVLDEALGWRSTFVCLTVLGGVLLALCWIDFGETNASRSGKFATQFHAYPELFRSRRFWGYSLCMAFSVSAFYTFISAAPLVAGTALRLSSAELGVGIGSITAGFFFGSFLSGRYATRFTLTTMMIAGRITSGVGLMLGLALFAAGVVNEFSMFGSTIFVGVGNGLTLPGANAGAMSVRPQLAGAAAGLSGAL